MTSTKGKLKERHHWWPECVSEHWRDANGIINVIGADGREFPGTPKNVGLIGNGHIIKLGKEGEATPWDSSFEASFDAADSAFPRVIAWLEGLERRRVDQPAKRQDRFIPQPITNEMFADVIECLVSLAVRSPMFRASAVSVAIHLRGPLEPSERHVIEAMNMRHCQRMISDTCKMSGKLVAIYAKEGEFIFGDGFFNTATGVSGPPHSPRMFVPITPQIAMLYTKPMAFMTEPRLTTLVVDPAEVDALNNALQVYAKDWLFYRTAKPVLSEHFTIQQHRMFSDGNNSVEMIMRDIPGVRTSGMFGF